MKNWFTGVDLKIAVGNLKRLNLFDKIKFEVQEKPLLGICLGMQLWLKLDLRERVIWTKSVPGKAVNGLQKNLHYVGWNKIEFASNSSYLMEYLTENSFILSSFMFIPDNKTMW